MCLIGSGLGAHQSQYWPKNLDVDVIMGLSGIQSMADNPPDDRHPGRSGLVSHLFSRSHVTISTRLRSKMSGYAGNGQTRSMVLLKIQLLSSAFRKSISSFTIARVCA